MSLDSHSLCCVEDVLYVGGEDEGDGATVGAESDALLAFDLSTRIWTVRAPLPEPCCFPACVQLAGHLYVSGCSAHRDLNETVFSYDPRTDLWRSE